MKHFKRSILPLVAVVLLGSCSKDYDRDIDDLIDRVAKLEYLITWGTIYIDPPATAENWSPSPRIYIEKDDGTRIVIRSSTASLGDIESGERVIANYTPYYSASSSQVEAEVRLNMISSVLSKGYIVQSFVNEDIWHRKDSIGRDPLRLLFAGFGGKYLNVEFTARREAGSTVKHMVSLVRDDVGRHNDSVYLTLYHNSFGDTGADSLRGFASFDIESIIPPGADTVNVRLIWKDYEGKMRFDVGTFRRPRREEAAPQ